MNAEKFSNGVVTFVRYLVTPVGVLICSVVFFLLWQSSLEACKNASCRRVQKSDAEDVVLILQSLALILLTPWSAIRNSGAVNAGMPRMEAFIRVFMMSALTFGWAWFLQDWSYERFRLPPGEGEGVIAWLMFAVMAVGLNALWLVAFLVFLGFARPETADTGSSAAPRR